jgi:hypothetical protein
MGYARYVGRGAIFPRLKARLKAQPLELKYFSFFVVADKPHEREIETLLIRAGGPHLHFNSRKKRIDIKAGNVRDFEAGTDFYRAAADTWTPQTSNVSACLSRKRTRGVYTPRCA